MVVSVNQQLSSVQRVVSQCQGTKFFGEVTLVMRNGNVVDIRLIQSIKPEGLLTGEETPVLIVGEPDATPEGS